MSDIILEVKDLSVTFSTPEGPVNAVNNMNFTIKAGEALGVVGESGSGKSQTFLAIMGLLASNGKTTGSAKLLGRELIGLSADELNKIRGQSMSMIFQDPMTSLNPYLKVSKQLTEVLVLHKGMGEQAARAEALSMLEKVGIPEAKKRFDMYPHEFSGGMRQRVMIAMALLCEPALLIADEPTTALDVTIQAQILDLMRKLKSEFNTAIVMITHDLGVVAGLCDTLNVMYAGRIVERSSVDEVFSAPRHPYSQGLLASTPRLDEKTHDNELVTIPGQPPNLQRLPQGCAFAPRCAHVKDRCLCERPPLFETPSGSHSACYREEEVA
ncbi:oligopeptide transporter ATP-binding component [Kiloniella litopenaei]|uniref:Oligopeptide transporter ATP-binding component n=1 Tax=Kiloniella litopenaei TaxID=1549748 RepID=A0A0M2R8W5_9PROT|nr:oligopeptide/dipeptide ABC transporter ATP-binding protein [Kiloniella litopenaei]KKJ76395.1 oligopeptide transporter ATP-binding component [Kiloniella litopenaei]